MFKGKVSVLSYPSSNASVSGAFNANETYGIASYSKYKDAAWEFIKTLISEEIQSNMQMGGFAINKAAQKKMADQARAFGFCPTDPPDQTTCIDPTLSFEVPFQVGHFPVPAYFVDNDPLLAFSAIGLDNVVTNPLHMALVGASIANGGTMYEPRLVREIRDPQGRVIRTYDPTKYSQPVSPNTADQVRQLMVNVVESGTGYEAQIPGVVVAGKTGTATNGPGRNPNAWFVAFAPAGPNDVPRIAVAVIVLDGGDLGSEATGGRVAAPIAREVIAAFLRRSGG
jgi:peptidoglycan glycosyltransferase